MGMKYEINGFNYPYQGWYKKSKQTNILIKAVAIFVYYSIKYDAVDVRVRR